MKALVTDDSVVGRRILVGILRHQCGFTDIVEATDGNEAVECVKEGGFDAVLLDWNMPTMLGIDALKAIRTFDSTVPIVMVTGVTDRARVVEAIAAGANNYITKPFGPKTVIKKVQETMERAQVLAERRSTRKALIADDSKTMRSILTNTLKRKCGIEEVTVTEDGAQAIEATNSQDFDLILLDWNMPNMLGIDVLRTIRAAGKHTPVVMVTANDESSMIIEALDAGANNYLVKPFEPEDLAEKVKQVLEMHA